MYGLKEAAIPRFLIGVQVTQVCLGRFQVQVRLSTIATIAVEGKFVHRNRENGFDLTMERESTSETTRLGRLLDQSVVSVELADGGVLLLRFSNGDELLMFDDSSEYESYQITSAEGVLVV